MADASWRDNPAIAAQAQEDREIYHKAILEVADARPPEFSDEALALRFSEKHANDARYVAAWNKWLLWHDAHWQIDLTMRAFDMARAICRVASSEIEEQAKLATGIASAKTVAAVANLVRADRRHAAIAGQWDADAWSIQTTEEDEL